MTKMVDGLEVSEAVVGAIRGVASEAVRVNVTKEVIKSVEWDGGGEAVIEVRAPYEDHLGPLVYEAEFASNGIIKRLELVEADDG